MMQLSQEQGTGTSWPYCVPLLEVSHVERMEVLDGDPSYFIKFLQNLSEADKIEFLNSLDEKDGTPFFWYLISSYHKKDYEIELFDEQFEEIENGVSLWDELSIQSLMKHGADFSITDTCGGNIFHFFADHFGYFEIQALAEQFHPDVFPKSLLQEGDAEGRTPLHLAVMAGERRGEGFKTIQAIVNFLENVNSQDQYGCAPFFYLGNFAREDNFLEIIQFFLEKGADLNLQNSYGNTFFSFALTSGFFIPHLITPENIHVADNSGITPLGLAVQTLSFEVFEEFLVFLLENSKALDVNLNETIIVDEEGNSLFLRAIMENKLNLVKLLFEKELINLEFKNYDGLNALAMAVAYGSREVLEEIWQAYFPENNAYLNDERFYLPSGASVFSLLRFGDHAHDSGRHDVSLFFYENLGQDELLNHRHHHLDIYNISDDDWATIFSSDEEAEKIGFSIKDIRNKELEIRTSIQKYFEEGSEMALSLFEMIKDNSNINPTLKKSLKNTHFTNPAHVEPFSESLIEALEACSEHIEENAILENLLNKYVALLNTDSRPYSFFSFFGPYISRPFKQFPGPRELEVSYSDLEQIFLCLKESPERQFQNLISHWAFQLVYFSKVDLSPLERYWQPLKDKLLAGEELVLPNQENLELDYYNFRGFSSLLDCPEEEQLEHFFQIIFRMLYISGNQPLSFIAYNLSGVNAQAIEEDLLAILDSIRPEKILWDDFFLHNHVLGEECAEYAYNDEEVSSELSSSTYASQ
jgi:hypothetical protein